MRVAIIGSRKFSDRELFHRVLDQEITAQDHIVSGGADGPDSWAEEYAGKHNLPLTIYLPDWSKGRGAGLARNTLIVADCERVIAFWDGKSRGTLDTVRKAHNAGLPVDILVNRV